MNSRARIAVEHVVFSSKRSYQQTIDALEARLGTQESREAIVHLLDTNACFLKRIEMY